MKNLSKQASVAQLVALFSRFERKDGPPLRYRLLTGRMKGQAFVTLPGEKRHTRPSATMFRQHLLTSNRVFVSCRRR